MAEYSRIRVTPAEDEDIVIMAGAVEDAPTAETGDAMPTEEAVSEEVVIVDDAPSVPSRERDAYEETTLADLQRGGMSGMQKAIIALAIVAVAAFIIWYVLLR